VLTGGGLHPNIIEFTGSKLENAQDLTLPPSLMTVSVNFSKERMRFLLERVDSSECSNLIIERIVCARK